MAKDKVMIMSKVMRDLEDLRFVPLAIIGFSFGVAMGMYVFSLMM